MWSVITSKCLYLQSRFCFQPLGKCIMFVFYYSQWNVSLVYHSSHTKKSCAKPVCEYLTGCLDAEDGHSCLRVTLELVDQMDPLWGWDTAVDADITSLEQKRQGDKTCTSFWRKIQLVSHESSASLNQLETPAMCTADGAPETQKSLNEKLVFRLISVSLRETYITF